MPTLRILVKGKVQGVFFRASAQETADDCGVKGWVRNTEEGHVELVASGSEEQLQAFVAWCRKGPRRALVEEVYVEPREEEPFTSFRVIR